MGERVPDSERPVLLAKASQYGYVEVNPNHPDLSRAMALEPEPLSPAQLEDLRYREQILRTQAHQAAQGGLDALEHKATRLERRAIRNARHALAALAVAGTA